MEISSSLFAPKKEVRRIAVVGGGRSSAVGLAHMSALAMAKRWSLVAAAPSASMEFDGTPKLPGFFDYEVPRIFRDWRAMLSDPSLEIDTVLVLAPTPLHFEISQAVLETGRHLICEKPGATSYAEITELVDLQRRKGVPAHVVFNYTGFPAYRAMLGYLSESRIGGILSVRAEMLQHGFRRKASGAVPMPQRWRLRDYKIPTVSLDLGVHVLKMVELILRQSEFNLVANVSESPLFGVAESVDILGNSLAGEALAISYGKRFLGKENSLRFQVFGELGALEWSLEAADELKITNDRGISTVLTRESYEHDFPQVMGLSRFKSGHPNGFVEGLANYYEMVFDDLAGNIDPILRAVTHPDVAPTLFSLEHMRIMNSGVEE